jgi:hypothetical protein
MPTKIQVRRGTAQQWVDSDTVLDSGEIGFETDTGLFKIGDGTTAYTALEYPPSGEAVNTESAVIAGRMFA